MWWGRSAWFLPWTLVGPLTVPTPLLSLCSPWEVCSPLGVSCAVVTTPTSLPGVPTPWTTLLSSTWDQLATAQSSAEPQVDGPQPTCTSSFTLLGVIPVALHWAVRQPHTVPTLRALQCPGSEWPPLPVSSPSLSPVPST